MEKSNSKSKKPIHRFKKGDPRPENSGIRKGTRNRVTQVARALNKAGLNPDTALDPIVFMQLLMEGNAEALGLYNGVDDDENKIPGTLLIPLEARFAAAKELASYTYSRMAPKPVDNSQNDNGGGVLMVPTTAEPVNWAKAAEQQQRDLRQLAHSKVIEHDPAD